MHSSSHKVGPKDSSCTELLKRELRRGGENKTTKMTKAQESIKFYTWVRQREDGALLSPVFNSADDHIRRHK